MNMQKKMELIRRHSVNHAMCIHQIPTMIAACVVEVGKSKPNDYCIFNSVLVTCHEGN
jgi:hypothetical protein